MDRKAFGADRRKLLLTLAETQPNLSLVARQGQAIKGVGFARPGRRHDYIGPIVAESMDVAQGLLMELAQRIGPKEVMVDTMALDAAWCSWLSDVGLLVQRRLTRMYSGTNDSPGETGLVYALSGFETG